jgi:hypothetical protein
MAFLNFSWPWALTDEQREERQRRNAEERLRKELQKRLVAESKHLQKQIPLYLARMEICYRKKKSEKDFFESDVYPIRLDKVQIGEDAYFYHIDTKRLPRGVFISHLKDPNTIETLTAACGSEVKFHYYSDTGYWYSVETRFGRGAIPSQVGYAEMLEKMAQGAAPLSFPMGMGPNQRGYFGNLDEMINLLVGGTKGGGKSNLINVLLCTLISRNAPDNLRLFLTDLKGGIEFIDYAGLPHLGGDVSYIEKMTIHQETGNEYRSVKTIPNDYKPKPDDDILPPYGGHICTEPGQVLPVLKYVEAEMDRRAKLLAGKAKKISAWNKRFSSKKLSYWIVVIDELASLMENKKFSGKATDSLSEIARKGRAVGIFLVLATQTPNSAIVPQQIANNMDSRAAFRTGSGVASGILLGDGKYDAVHLPNIAGRFIWRWGGENIEMQAPLIADTTVKKVVSDAAKGATTDAASAERAQKAEFLFSFALAKLGGECNSDIYQFVRAHNFTRKEVRSILEAYEVRGTYPGLEPEIEIDGDVYYLAPADIPRQISRWLVPAGDFIAGKHPNPNYVFDACRLPPASEPENSVDPESSITLEPDQATKADKPHEPLEPDEPSDLDELISFELQQEFEAERNLEPDDDLPEWLKEPEEEIS